MGEMLENARKQTLIHYREILRNIHEKPSIIAQTYKSSTDSSPVVSLRPLFLCLQCPNIMTETDRDQHFETKSHCFCRWNNVVCTESMADAHIAVESRDGHVYCGNCQDFIYDPELEIRRMQKGWFLHHVAVHVHRLMRPW
jgi:ubiquitin carboxyl-terminal hydrolase 22/27/51